MFSRKSLFTYNVLFWEPQARREEEAAEWGLQVEREERSRLSSHVVQTGAPGDPHQPLPTECRALSSGNANANNVNTNAFANI